MPTVNGPLSEHLEMLRREGIEIDAALLIPDCPEGLRHLMEWYDELRAWSRQGFSGVHPLTWTDADAWARRMRVNPLASEWRLLMQLDTRFRQAADKHRPKDKGR